MARRPREQATDVQQAPPAAPTDEPSTGEPSTDVVASPLDDARDFDFERYVADIGAHVPGGARPVMYLRADVVAARATDEQGED